MEEPHSSPPILPIWKKHHNQKIRTIRAMRENHLELRKKRMDYQQRTHLQWPITWQHTLQNEQMGPSSQPWRPNCKNISTQGCKYAAWPTRQLSLIQNAFTKPIMLTTLSATSTCLHGHVKGKLGFPSETLWLCKYLDQSSSGLSPFRSDQHARLAGMDSQQLANILARARNTAR